MLAIASLAIFVDMLLYSVIIPIQPLLLTRSGVDKSDLDYFLVFLSTSYSAAMMLSTPLFGWLSDSYDANKTLMILSLICFIVSTMLFGFVTHFYVVIGARMVQGVSAGATWVLGFALVIDAFPSDQGLGVALGVVNGFASIGSFIGPIIGGFMTEFFGVESAFVVIASLAAVALLILLPVRLQRIWSKDVTDANAPQPTFFALLLNKEIAVTLGIVLMDGASFAALETFFPAWLIEHFHYTESQISVMLLAIIIPNIVTTVVIGWLSEKPWVSKPLMISVGMVLHAIAAPLVPFSREHIFLVASCVAYGICSHIAYTASTIELVSIMERTYGSSTATLQALSNIAYNMGGIGGPILAGLIKSNPSWGFAGGMVSISICVGVLTFAYVLVRFCFAPTMRYIPLPNPADFAIGTPKKAEPVLSSQPSYPPASPKVVVATQIRLEAGEVDDARFYLPPSPAITVTRGSGHSAV